MKLIIGAITLYIVVGLIFPIGVYFTNYNDNVYDADIAKEWLWRARSTNSLDDMEVYLEKSLNGLEQYSGNPCWWYPKPDTNYDMIKLNIQETINNCNEWKETLTGYDFAYQQAVSNLQETIIEIAEHLDIANGWLCTPSLLHVILYLSPMWLLIISMIIAIFDDDLC